MSTTLLWQPAQTQGQALGYELKFALRERSGWTPTELDPVVLDTADVQWLEGVVQSKGQGAVEAEQLIQHISRHGSVKIWESS